MSQITDEQVERAMEAYLELGRGILSHPMAMRKALEAALSTPPVGAETGEVVAITRDDLAEIISKAGAPPGPPDGPIGALPGGHFLKVQAYKQADAVLSALNTSNEIDRLRGECARWIKEFDEKHALMLQYKSDATDAMALYNQEVEDFAKFQANTIRLSANDRQLLRMIAPFVDQRSREPGDAWNEAAAILWLLVDSSDPVSALEVKP